MKSGYYIQRRDYNSALSQHLIPEGSIILAGAESLCVMFTPSQARAYAEAGLVIEAYSNPMDHEQDSECSYECN